MDGAGEIILRCKCGWSMPAPRDESESLAAEHMAQFPDDDPAKTWNRPRAAERTGSERLPSEGRSKHSQRDEGITS